MIAITELRIQSDLAMKDFAERLGISLSTLNRIETAEFEGRKHPVSKRVAYRLMRALQEIVGHEVKMGDLTGITTVPRRPGRPKRNANSTDEVKTVA